ncbi:MAG: ATP-binding protein [Cytophagales bacterium]|nr:ATP-binding protein [Cytophagales bacterium]
MKYIILIMIFCSLQDLSFSQQTYTYFVDGFRLNLTEEPCASPEDTIRVSRLREDAQKNLFAKNYSESFELARQACNLSTSLNHKYGLAESLLLMARIKYQQGLEVSESKKTPLYAQSHDYFLESLKTFEKLKATKKTADVCLQIGLLYKEWGQFHEKAISYFKRSLELKKDMGDMAGCVEILHEISNSYTFLQNHERAITYQVQLLEIYLEQKNDREALDVRRNISESYHELKKFDEALEQELKILDLKKKLNDSIGVVNSYNNLGFIHKHLKRYKDALHYFDKCLNLTRKYNTTRQATLMEKTVLMNKGIIYRTLLDYKNSNKNFYEALSIWVARGKPEEIANIYNKIGKNYMAIGDLESARNSFRQALSTAKDSQNNQFVAYINKELSEIYKKLGDDKNALECYQSYARANDAYLMEQNKKQEELLQQQYKINIAETDKKLAIAEREIKEIELEKKRNENALLRRERELLKQKEDLQKALLLNEHAEKTKARQELIILEQQYELDKKNKDNKLLQQRDSIRSLEVEKIALEEKQKEQQLALLKEKAYNQQLILDEQRAREGFFNGIFVALAIIVFLALRSYLVKKKANKILARQNKEIQTQRDQLEQAYYNLKQLSEIGKNITSNLSIGRIIETVFRNVSPLMDASVFGVGLYNEQTKCLEFPGLKEKGETIIMISYDIRDKRRLAVRCFEDKKAIFVNDFQNEFKQYIEEIPPSVTGTSSSSIIYLPLIVKEKAIGVITVQSFKKNAYSEYHLNILRNLAVHTAIALENAANYGQIKDKTIKLENTLKDLKAAQAQLIQSEKMASLGQLTAGIAHEINNPINFVYAGIDGLNTSLDALMEILNKYEEIEEFEKLDNIVDILQEINRLKDKLYFEETKESVHDLINAIRDGAQRTAEIVEGLRNFSRINETELKKVNVHKGIESSLVLLNSKINQHQITVTKTYDPNAPDINCYPGQLNQVFMNLISNAIEAIEGGGEIRIASRNLEDYMVISIKDNGVGMSKEMMDKIFDPFFTTKDLGKGTGLGLSISFGIIEKHKGRLEVKSKPGMGSTFSIYLPKNLERKKKRHKAMTVAVNA